MRIVTLGLFAVMASGVISARGQCLLPAEFYPSLPNWANSSEVTDFVDMVGPEPWWELVVTGVPQVILEHPTQTDLGQSPEGADFLFTVRHTANACTDTWITGTPSSGSLMTDSTEPVGLYTEAVHYRFSPTGPGDVFFDFTLLDSSDATLHEATLKLSVLPVYTLTVSRGSGVTGEPSVSGDYLENTVVDYAYHLEPCYENLGITLDAAPVPASGNVLMDDDHALVSNAAFIQYEIDVASTTGGYTDRDGTNSVDCGDTFTITAFSDTCYDFSFWSGDASGSDNPLVLNDVSENQSITANFVQQTYTVTVASTAGGSTDHDGANTVNCGDDFTVEAIPDTGYLFSGWTGDISSNDNPLTIEDVTEDFNITANFSPAATIDLSVSEVKVIQGITMAPAYRVHIADRPAVVRVFVGISGSPSISGVTGRLTRYVGGVPQDSITQGPMTAPASPSEGNLNHTLNFQLPSHWLSTGTAYVLELDPNHNIAEFNEANNRYPASGSQSFEFQAVDDLDIVVVPIEYTNAASQTTLPSTSPFPPPYLTWFPEKVYPIHQINYSLHAVHPFNGNLKVSGEWNRLLNEVTAIHNAEDPGHTKEYYGLVNFYDNDGCAGGCIAGMGWVGLPTAVGFSGWGAGTNEASETMTHELGHNFGRNHAPCGVSNPDPGYPYANGKIGQWGLDVAAMTLKSPATFYDYMSYCNPVWTSDYTYAAIYNFRETHTWKTMPEFQDAFYLGGSIEPDGSVQLLPLFRHQAPIDDTTTGSHRLILRDGNGSVLGSHDFTPRSIADGNGGVGFNLFVPYQDGIAEITLYDGSRLIHRRASAGSTPRIDDIQMDSNASGDLEVRWIVDQGPPDVAYRLRLSRDGGQTWKVISLHQSENFTQIRAPQWQAAPDPILEIQAVDGVRVATETIRLK